MTVMEYRVECRLPDGPWIPFRGPFSRDTAVDVAAEQNALGDGRDYRATMAPVPEWIPIEEGFDLAAVSAMHQAAVNGRQDVLARLRRRHGRPSEREQAWLRAMGHDW